MPAWAHGYLLAPEPTVRAGTLIGYAGVSTSGQLLDRQEHALAEAEAGHSRLSSDHVRPSLAVDHRAG